MALAASSLFGPYALSSVSGSGAGSRYHRRLYWSKAVQGSGFKGAGIRVAMLDTGIDYTHYNLGGSGIVADFTTAPLLGPERLPHSVSDDESDRRLDFTGEVWPNGPLAPDPNPMT